MKSFSLSALALSFALTGAACATDMAATPVVERADDFEIRTATVIGGEGQTIGSVKMTQAPKGMLIRVELGAGSLTPGWHGIHLHQVGDCSDVGEFKRSGGHLGMIPDGHGLLNPAGPEIGDLTNIWAAADGSAGYEVFQANLYFDGDEKVIFDGDGTAVIIHANPDDHITQPIGGAGPRVACAAFTK